MHISNATVAVAGWIPPVLQESEFDKIRGFLYEWAGISLNDSKKALVSSRLEGRLRQLRIRSFAEYIRVLADGDKDERQIMVDLLTTNETHFFRESKHFDFMAEQMAPEWAREPQVRVWSAACSSGEEVYSLAMALAEFRGASGWHVLGTDISRRMIDAAEKAVYPQTSMHEIPQQYLPHYCLKGVRSQEGTFAIENALKKRTSFKHLNLHGAWPAMEKFHAIFVRNVMIYFEPENRRRLVERLRNQLVPGGYLIVGHAESMSVTNDGFRCIRPSIYRVR